MTFSNDCHMWITLLLFIYLPSELLALQCYVCNSYVDAKCIGADLDKFKTECKSHAVGCRKIHYYVKFNELQENMEERVERQCAKTKNEFGCKQVFGTNGKRYNSKYCECATSLCNAATTTNNSRQVLHLFALFSSLAIILFFLK
ncbi:hypothetical protein Btru_059858 [Bulinus truncatus]|nr:hypothetical protein Btru_059858 [Bulinus truncatus]